LVAPGFAECTGKVHEALPHETPLITTLVAGFGLAFLFGLLAQRLKLPLIAGYLLAGVVIGPFTPGYVADMKLATELAELSRHGTLWQSGPSPYRAPWDRLP